MRYARRAPALSRRVIDIAKSSGPNCGALLNALGAFLFVNLLGLLFLGMRSVFRWRSAGYR
jgi:hypothetical protein